MLPPHPPVPPHLPACTCSVLPSPIELYRCSSWLSENCQAMAVPSDSADKLELCLNEVLANLIDHAGAERLGTRVDLALELADQEGRRQAILTISDDGPAFDPLTITSRPLPSSLQEAEVGGLGLRLVHHFTDARSYQRSSGRNVLKLGIDLPAED